MESDINNKEIINQENNMVMGEQQIIPQQPVPPHQQMMPQQPVPPQQQMMSQQPMPPQPQVMHQMPPHQMPPQPMPPYGQPVRYSQKPVVKHPNESVERYKIMAIPSALYALVCAICLYKNWSGIFTALFSFISVAFICFSLVRYEKNEATKNSTTISTGGALKKQSKLVLFYIGILLYGIATFLTNDGIIVFICHTGILFLEIIALASYFNNIKRWGLCKAFVAIGDVLISPFAYIGEIFIDYTALKKQQGKKGYKGIYVFLGIAISLPILGLVLKLLSTADEVFETVVKKIFGTFLFSWDALFFAIFAFVVLLFVYGIVVKLPKKDLTYMDGKSVGYDPVIGITITSILTAFYLLFSVIQILYLFINNMQLPGDMTYADYARRGFFQLLFVAILNLIIVLICLKLFKKSTPLNVVLAIMSGCTYIMIASSFVRMLMYIKEYDLSYARVVVLFLLVLTALLMTGVFIKIFGDTFPLFKYSIVVISIVFILFAYVRPGNLIASYNLSHADEDVDISYIIELGSDAAPALCEYLEENNYSKNDLVKDYSVSYNNSVELENSLESILERNEKYEKIRGFNVSRYFATKSIENYLENN